MAPVLRELPRGPLRDEEGRIRRLAAPRSKFGSILAEVATEIGGPLELKPPRPASPVKEVITDPVKLKELKEKQERLEESQQRARERRAQKQKEREAAQRREMQMQKRMPGTSGPVAKPVLGAGPPHVQNIVETEPDLTLERALALQCELIAGFSERPVQRKLKHLQNTLQATDRKAYETECYEIMMKVQSAVLPTYGLPATDWGVQRMLKAFQQPAICQNATFQKNSEEINHLLFANPGKPSGLGSFFDGDGPARDPEKEAFRKRLAMELKRVSTPKDGSWRQDGPSDFSPDAKAVARRQRRGQGEAGEEEEQRLRREAASLISGSAGSMGTEERRERFDGEWDDGEGTILVIAGGKLHGPDGSPLDFATFDGNRCSLCMEREVFEGRLSADGRLLWKDGSMWVRKCASGPESMEVKAAGEEGGSRAGLSSGGGGGSGQGSVAGGAEANEAGASTEGPKLVASTKGPAGGSGGGEVWYEEVQGAPGRIFQATMPSFHPPQLGYGANLTIWRESGIPIVRAQYSTDGTRVKRRGRYADQMDAMSGGGYRNYVPEKIREDVRSAIRERNATKFVEAMEFMESVFDQDEMIKKELNKTLSALSDADKKAASRFILESLPHHQQALLEMSMNKSDFEVQSVLADPSWYSEWEVPRTWLLPFGILFAAHQQHLLLNPEYTSEPHKWDPHQ